MTNDEREAASLILEAVIITEGGATVSDWIKLAKGVVYLHDAMQKSALETQLSHEAAEPEVSYMQELINKNECNKHTDCKAADDKAHNKEAVHCYYEFCEDCFGC